MMSKRIAALLLCLLMCMTALIGCSEKITTDDDHKGAYINLYLTDEIYNFDPAYAYLNEEAESIVSLMFSRLFTLDSKGKLKYDLAEEYVTKEDEKTKEYTMTITLRDAWWSDKIKLTADDVVFAWKRILSAENSFACASLLFDLKNARAVKAGNCSIDDLGVCALNDNTLQITFEKPIDYDQFLLNLTSLALAPLREDYVTKGPDWAKKPGTMVSSGPFKMSKAIFADTANSYMDINGDTGKGVPYDKPKKQTEAVYALLVLERNICYDRDPEEDDLALNKSVEPYRILINCLKSDEALLEALNGGVVETFEAVNDLGEPEYDSNGNRVIDQVVGDIYYMGSIPLSLRQNEELMDRATITDALSTMSLYLNQDTLLKNKSTGESVALFANADVRAALSLALDRDAIAKALVLADAATGLVPNGIFNQGYKGSFRKEVGDLLATSADLAAAQQKLTAASVKASDYSFTITVNANDDCHMLMAEAAVEAWTQLGFDVEIEKRGTIRNNDYYAPTDTTPLDICDDLYMEDIDNRNFTVAVIDYCAYSADAYSLLAPFAADFSGMVDTDFNMVTHVTGYNSEAYNTLMEAIYYLPYYNQVTSADYKSFKSYENEEAFQAVLDRVNAVYTEYGIDTKNATAGRTILLHEAETLLMKELPVIPVVFNKNATVGTGALKGVKSDLYISYKLADARLKNYKDFLEDGEKMYSDFDIIYKSLYPSTK